MTRSTYSKPVGDPETEEKPILSVENLTKHFPIKEGVFQRTTGHVKAVDGVNLEIYPGETHGLVGESGCGKTTLMETMLYLQDPTAGTVEFKGERLGSLSDSERRKLRQEIQIVFQDPDGSLNPRMTVEQIVGEPLRVHTEATERQIKARVLDLLHDVGLSTEHLERFPHELSGGQKQRVAIARALSLNPSLVLLDEPTSALDVSVQSQMLNLLNDLKEEYNLTYVIITHDLSVVRYISDNISVMYVGNIVEQGPTAEIFEDPKHPYSKALLSAVPIPDPHYEPETEIVLSGNVPDPSNPPEGCRFHPRCPIAIEECSDEFPAFEQHGESEVRCIRAGEETKID